MSKKQFGFKLPLGFTDVDMFMDVLKVTAERIRRKLLIRDVTPKHKLTGIEIIDNKDFSYSIMFNFDDEPSIEEIFDRAITGGN